MARAQRKPERRLIADVSWRQLCLIAKEQRDTGLTTDEIEWKERVKTRVVNLGFKLPFSSRVYRAIDATKAADRQTHGRTQPWARTHPPSTRDVPGWTRVSDLFPQNLSNVCGCLKHASGAAPLKCTLPVGHDGEHGVHDHRGVMWVRWSR